MAKCGISRDRLINPHLTLRQRHTFYFISAKNEHFSGPNCCLRTQTFFCGMGGGIVVLPGPHISFSTKLPKPKIFQHKLSMLGFEDIFCASCKLISFLKAHSCSKKILGIFYIYFTDIIKKSLCSSVNFLVNFLIWKNKLLSVFLMYQV